MKRRGLLIRVEIQKGTRMSIEMWISPQISTIIYNRLEMPTSVPKLEAVLAQTRVYPTQQIRLRLNLASANMVIRVQLQFYNFLRRVHYE